MSEWSEEYPNMNGLKCKELKHDKTQIKYYKKVYIISVITKINKIKPKKKPCDKRNLSNNNLSSFSSGSVIQKHLTKAQI
jgi:hypothetical protein